MIKMILCIPEIIKRFRYYGYRNGWASVVYLWKDRNVDRNDPKHIPF